MILQDAFNTKGLKLKKKKTKKSQNKKVKVRFSEWKNITNMPDLRWKHWILQYWDDLFILLCDGLKGMFMYILPDIAGVWKKK